LTETVTIPREVLEKVIDHLEEITGARAALSALREVAR
jgi:hypothetical protein